MAESAEHADNVQDRADVYTAWATLLRSDGSLPDLCTDTAGPLQRLGQELQLLADNLSRREHELRQLFNLVGTTEQVVLVEDVLKRIFEGFKGLIPFDRIGCAFLSNDGASLRAYWVRSELGLIQIAAGYSQPLAGSSLEEVLKTGRPRIINDLELYLKDKPQSDATRRIVLEGGRSSIVCPLVMEHRPIGLLFFTSKNKDAYQEAHQMIFRQIAGQVSAVIDNSRVYLQIIERNRQLVEESKQLVEIATRDALTEVLNRGAIMQAAERALTDAARTGKPIGIIMIDIDHFKEVNDTLGHAAGDLVLKDFARRLSGVIRQSDQLGRYGGEEFLIIAAGPLTTETLNKAAERLRKAINASPFDVSGAAKIVSASFGAVIATGIKERVQDVVAAADRALYAAKNGGRDRVVIGVVGKPAAKAEGKAT